MRGCPEPVHEALKKSAKANRRSLTKETVTWLEREAARDAEERPISGREFARRLREFKKLMTPKEHREFAEAIEEGIKRFAHERLH